MKSQLVPYNGAHLQKDNGSSVVLFFSGEEGSSEISATWEDENNLIATVESQGETYVIEPSWRHLPEPDNHTMIIYRKSDINMDEDVG